MSDPINYTPLPNYNYPPGTIVRIDGKPYKHMGEIMPGRINLMDCVTGQPFLIPDGAGAIVLPSQDDYDRLIIEGRLEIEMPSSVVASRALAAIAEWDMSDLEALDPGIRKTEAQIKVLDDNGVKNGVKAIAAGLKKFWTKEHRERFGDPDNPATIKRWRSERGTPGERDPKLLVRLNGKVPRAPYLHDVPEEVKQKHALATRSSKGTVKAGYALAATEIREINRGLSSRYPKPDKPYPVFSYDTFRRACIALDGSETTGARDGEKARRGHDAGRRQAAHGQPHPREGHHRPHAAVRLPGRGPERDVVAGKPWLTVAFDVHSRVALA